jgi:hypothetical protein
MAHVFRYPLTRFCLRSGTLTLPRTMVGLFPDSGEVVVVDTITDEEFSVIVDSPRSIAGFSSLFKRHQLAVNDELVIEALDDGRFAVTAAAHAAPDETPSVLRRVLDEVYEAEVPVTEGEVRALFPTVPADVDLLAAFESDGRFAQRHGRWHSAAALAAEALAAATASPVPTAAHERTQDTVMADAGMVEAGVEATTVSVRSSAGAGGAVGSSAGAGGATGAIAQHLGAASHDTPAFAAGPWAAPGGAGGHAADRDSHTHTSVFERRTPAAETGENTGRSEPSATLDDDDGASLEATELANRLRAALLPLGFRLEPLGRGQLNVHADMGRRGYRVLVQLLSRTERLDWADLLARRRSTGVKYLAVVGDHRDLLRLTNPADLARATMWSWQALDRMSLLHRSVPLSPIELEAHFERDGLFEQGLQRLEATVAQRVAERGAMSEVLARLAVMRSPSVFLLEELAGELGMSRELALRILERLTDPPFHLVAKVDAGEFVLRQRVSDALATVTDYAASLRARLPVKQVERLVASGEPDLLTDSDDLDHVFGRGRAEA